jgi:hypothetical protein
LLIGCGCRTVAITEVLMVTLTDLAPHEAASRLLADQDDRWISELTDELLRRKRGRELERVASVWQLSRRELGELFGVSRQAVTKWLDTGVPPDRAEQVADVQAITDLLERYLKRERIPAVVRRPAPKLDDASLLELVRTGRAHDALLLTRAMFTFADAHT